MTEPQKCHVCHKATGDGFACKACAAEARTHLESIAYLAFHIDDKRARVSAIDYRTASSRTAETPLPYDPRVTRVVDPIITALLGTHAVVAEGARGIDLDVDVDNLADLATWISCHVDWLRTTPEGPEEFETFERCASNLDRLFDRPPDQLYLGICSREDDDGNTCPEPIYVEHKRPLPSHVECRRCGHQVIVNDRRDTFRDAVAGYQATMRELVRLAPLHLEDGVSHRTLKEWTRHGLLPPRGERVERNIRGEWRKVPTYRIGDLAEARNAWEVQKDRRSRREGARQAS